MKITDSKDVYKVNSILPFMQEHFGNHRKSSPARAARMAKATSQQPAPSMTMIMVPEEEWRSLHDTLEQITKLITRRKAEDSNGEWIESEDARKILGVSPKTWQNYRDQRIIPFSQMGRKIYVNRADLDAFLLRHRIPAIK